MNEKEQEILCRLLIDLFLDNPGRKRTNQQKGRETLHAEVSTSTGGTGEQQPGDNADAAHR
jgi:hypothetical protein